MVQDAPTAKRLRSVARAVLLAAASSALLGIALETTAHVLLSNRRAVWLIKPYLYAGLPKPFVHTDWFSVASSVAVAILMLGWALFRGAQSRPTPGFIWLGLGLILGGAISEAVVGIALGTITSILVLARGAWRYAFSPFDVMVVVGFMLVLPELVRSRIVGPDYLHSENRPPQ
jgi:hypothetical protein